MKDDYRETPGGRTVKYDSDPENDYSDGYNAGRRYKKKTPWWFWLVLLLLLIPLLWLLSLMAWPWEKGANQTSPAPSPTASPAASVTPKATPKATPGSGSSSLPGVGGYQGP